MIKRVGKVIENGDIIEFNQNSEPLYLYHNRDLIKITPQEYNHILQFEAKDRDWELTKFRLSIEYSSGN